jgi:BirA family biotin operon repressor/biotin-[acetyl-CoA-carboxylase] ligase
MAAWAAVSVCETILACTGLQAKIKWPNDVLLRGRKVCGILIEQARGTVVGIGLNVSQSADSFAHVGLPDAGSLALFTSAPLEWQTVARQLIQHLDEEYDRLCAGDRGTLEACWKWRSGLLGREVVVECHDAMHRGRLLDMTWEGLVLEVREDGTRMILPETVKHIRENCQ